MKSPKFKSKGGQISVVHTWTKDYVKYDGYNVEPVHIFLSGSGGTGKSHLVKVIYNSLFKALIYNCKAKSSLIWTYKNIRVKNRWNHHSFWFLELHLEQTYLV